MSKYSIATNFTLLACSLTFKIKLNNLVIGSMLVETENYTKKVSLLSWTCSTSHVQSSARKSKFEITN